MAWGPDKRIMELFDLADRKSFGVIKSTMRDSCPADWTRRQ
jgi:hypothetical protein